jgi:hypothetical protein
MPLPFRKHCLLWIVAYSVFCFFSRAAAQQVRSAQSTFAAPNLQQLIQQSGFIFAGTVTSVHRFSPPKSGEIASSRITFRVEQAIRGVREGQLLEVRDWAGLWNSGERYRAGERVVLFLYPRSRLGLTSPVGGALGRFNITSQREIVPGNIRRDAASPSVGSLDPARPTSHVSANQFVRAIRRELGE